MRLETGLGAPAARYRGRALSEAFVAAPKRYPRPCSGRRARGGEGRARAAAGGGEIRWASQPGRKVLHWNWSQLSPLKRRESGRLAHGRFAAALFCGRTAGGNAGELQNQRHGTLEGFYLSTLAGQGSAPAKPGRLSPPGGAGVPLHRTAPAEPRLPKRLGSPGQRQPSESIVSYLPLEQPTLVSCVYSALGVTASLPDAIADGDPGGPRRPALIPAPGRRTRTSRHPSLPPGIPRCLGSSPTSIPDADEEPAFQ